MNRRERKQQQKKKARQERLRHEKHLRQTPREKADGTLQGSESPGKNTPDPAVGAAPNPAAFTVNPPDARLDDFFRGEPASKWLDALLAADDSKAIVETLWAAELPGELLLKASVCCEMLVAAELVATGRGRPSRHLPPRVAAWLVEQDLLFSPGVVALAAMAVRRVGAFSELRQLWDKVNLAAQWLHGLDDLQRRLESRVEL